MTKINVDELNEDGLKKLDSGFAWVMDLIRNSRLSVFMKNFENNVRRIFILIYENIFIDV